MTKALVLSGGGSKGAYQVGVLKHILGTASIDYQIFCGVSVGALNAMALAMFPSGQEKEALQKILNIWENVETKDVRKRWFPFGVLHALWKPSLYNSSPLKDLVQKEFNADALKSSGKKLAVGAASLTTGNYQIFFEDNPQIVDCVLASSSFPTMLTPVEINGELWTDGGVRDVTPIKAAIDMGATEIDVIMSSHDVEKMKNIDDDPNTIDVAVRTLEILTDEVIENDIKVANLINELVNAGLRPDKKKISIRLIRPSSPLPGASLDFENKDIAKMIDLGLNDAQKANWQ